MFVLRKITGSGIQSNICLNKVYNLIIYHPNVSSHKHSNDEEFIRTLELPEFKDLERDKIYGFIIYEEGSKIEPLYKAQKNYIVMSDGNTFANISWR